MSRILAIDLGKFKSVTCLLDTATNQTEFWTMCTDRPYLLAVLQKYQPDLVVIESCSLAGWVHDECTAEGYQVLVCNPNQEAWKWKHVKRKTDRDDALKLAKLAALGQLVPVYIPRRQQREYRRLVKYRQVVLEEIQLTEAFHRRFPDLPQVACFDTAFHHDLPRVAQLLPIPRHYEAQGVRRYGFHGLSYAFLMGELARLAGVEAAQGRIILAHLGNGASLAAVRDGKSLDTSMSFTPTAGVPMSTRSGDLDPGLVWYLARTEEMSAKQFNEMVNFQSGLLGISETSSDMHDLLDREAQDVRAAEAVALFCYHVKKWIGAFAAALGGLDTLVFAGGIGENAPTVRARICDGLGFLGIEIEEKRNTRNEGVISAAASRVAVRVIHTDEELMIARTVTSLLSLDAPKESCMKTNQISEN